MCDYEINNTDTSRDKIPEGPGENCTTRLWAVIYFNHEDDHGNLVSVTEDRVWKRIVTICIYFDKIGKIRFTHLSDNNYFE